MEMLGTPKPEKLDLPNSRTLGKIKGFELSRCASWGGLDRVTNFWTPHKRVWSTGTWEKNVAPPLSPPEARPDISTNKLLSHVFDPPHICRKFRAIKVTKWLQMSTHQHRRYSSNLWRRGMARREVVEEGHCRGNGQCRGRVSVRLVNKRPLVNGKARGGCTQGGRRWGGDCAALRDRTTARG